MSEDDKEKVHVVADLRLKELEELKYNIIIIVSQKRRFSTPQAEKLELSYQKTHSSSTSRTISW